MPEPDWLTWTRELQAMAQTGLAFARDPYDRERYEMLRGLASRIMVCDNGGFAVINRLQNGKGVASFNNLIADCKVREPFAVEFAKHAESIGALTRRVESLAERAAQVTGRKKQRVGV
jgi:TPP-dependent trihydroxycyclohexane-1,2-dione (THcHDO) dehydratase